MRYTGPACPARLTSGRSAGAPALAAFISSVFGQKISWRSRKWSCLKEQSGLYFIVVFAAGNGLHGAALTRSKALSLGGRMKKVPGELDTGESRWPEPLVLLVGFALVFLLVACQLAVAATFTVTNTNSMGPGSLEDAIIRADTMPGHDIIRFNIPGVGPHTIKPLSPLSPLVDPSGVTIDGFTQSGASPGSNPPSSATLMIELDGRNLGPGHGLPVPGFFILSSNNVIQGIVIDSFENDGIRIQAVQDTASFNYIFCNFIGTDRTGSVARGNGYDQEMPSAGINILVRPGSGEMYARNNIIDANLISGNHCDGIRISGFPPGDIFSNRILNNYIGTDISGNTDLGNKYSGVYIGEGARNNVVRGNLISGNEFEGVCIVGNASLGVLSRQNVIEENIIGLSAAFAPLPNGRDGVSIGVEGATGEIGWAIANEIGPNNVIAYNGRNGVLVWEHPNSPSNADQNRISENSIYDNVGLGIDLGDNGVTFNDLKDPDSGPNEELNFPEITSITYDAGLATITGTVDIDVAPSRAVIEVFRASPDPANHGEGDLFLDSAEPDTGGNWTVVVAGLSSSDFVTTTVTDLKLNTSEFSRVEAVVGVEEQGSRLNVQGLTFEVLQNEPNPFHGRTVIGYSLPASGKATLKVYNTAGRLVDTIVDEEQKAGVHRVEWSPKQASSGIYFYRLESGNHFEMKKMILLR